MYLFKNAWRNISRSLGKNILIGIIVFIISLSSCLALSIKEAAKSEKEEGLANINITASISYDRKGQMEGMKMEPPTGEDGEIDKDAMKDSMKDMFNFDSLSLEELQTYAEAESVKDFYYTLSSSLNGNDALSPIESETSSMGGKMGREDGMSKMSSSDFSITAYSSYEAMSDFTNGTKSIEEGSLFTLESEDECIISDELALYNSLEVGDSITLVNPDNEEDTFTLTICGIYTNVSSTMNMGMSMSDPANEIYTNVTALNAMVTTSESNSSDTAISASVNGTYVFEDVDAYETFCEEAYEMGLDEAYTISSTDITSYEQSLQPLENLSNYANIFLWIILVIGGIILVVFNIFRLKERKYEIGVLAAIGMNKVKVATQYVIEVFIVTFLALLLGLGVGCVSSVPVTNALLESTSSTNIMDAQMPSNMGDMENMPEMNDSNEMEKPSNGNMMDNLSGVMDMGKNFISEVDSAANLSVVIQLLGIGILLTIVSSGMSVITILRYEPLRILSERD